LYVPVDVGRQTRLRPTLEEPHEGLAAKSM
jgi:hypothetical protein